MNHGALTPILLTAYGPEWISNTEIIFWAKASLWRMNIRDGSVPERLPFVGEDGLMPAVWRPQPGRPGRLAYVRSSADINVWRIETSAAGAAASSPPVVAIRRRDGTSWRSFRLTVTGSRSSRIDRANRKSG